jgi:hypothetical protein
MDIAIHFDNQPLFRTIIIGNKWTNRMLAAKFQAIQLPTAQCIP